AFPVGDGRGKAGREVRQLLLDAIDSLMNIPMLESRARDPFGFKGYERISTTFPGGESFCLDFEYRNQCK
ncbi:MAG: hypothetical protein GY859_39410, partial [Desulfobacterales bacterium]|nr:hypothetical protein [Desulfobacterales bacterium]